MPPVLQTINKATGYTPDLGYKGNTIGSPYNANIYGSGQDSFRVAPAAPATADPYAAEIARLQAENEAINAQFKAAPKLLNFDYSAAQAKARSQAEGSVNPIYLQKLNNFLDQARTNEQRKTEDYNRTNSLYDEVLQKALEASGVSRNRVATDTQSNIDQVNNSAQNYQADTGTAFDRARNTLAGNTYQAGLTGSGLGAQQAAEAVKQRNTQEGRQVQSFDIAKQNQKLFLTRSLEDLATSDEVSKRNNSLSKEANKIDLNRYIQDYGTTDPAHYGTQIQAEINQEAVDRQNAVLDNQKQQYGDIFNQYLSTLGGARGQDIALTKSVYGV